MVFVCGYRIYMQPSVYLVFWTSSLQKVHVSSKWISSIRKKSHFQVQQEVWMIALTYYIKLQYNVNLFGKCV